jgi:hypothetical protein
MKCGLEKSQTSSKGLDNYITSCPHQKILINFIRVINHERKKFDNGRNRHFK